MVSKVSNNRAIRNSRRTLESGSAASKGDGPAMGYFSQSGTDSRASISSKLGRARTTA